MKSDAATPVKSVETAIRMIEALEALDGAGISELATELGVAKSTVHDHLKTLEAHEFVCRHGNRYHVGLRFLDHGGRARSRRKVYAIAKPEVARLAEETAETTNLVVEEHGLGVYIDVSRGAKAINLDTYIGKREYLHNTAVGKAILAHLPEAKVEDILDRWGMPSETERTLTSRDGLEAELRETRERGYAIDREERLPGLRCVAAPIVREGTDVVGAISVSGPASRMDDDRIEGALADKVIQTANIIEVNVTYS